MSLIRRRSPLDLESFEFVPATSDRALVRVRGSWRTRADRPGNPVLVAEQDGVVQRFTALPDPEARGGSDDERWRAAFALPVELVRGGGTSFQLEAGGGRLLQLPAPVQALPERRHVPDRRLGDRRRQDGAAPRGKERRVRQRRRVEDRRRRRSQAELKAFADRVAELRGQVEELRETRQWFESRMQELEAEVQRRRSAETADGHHSRASSPG